MDRDRGNLPQAISLKLETIMRIFRIVISGVSAVMSLAVLLAPEAPARAGDVPEYFKEIVRTETSTPAEVAAKNILALNATMFDLYANAAQIFKKNILAFSARMFLAEIGRAHV